MGGFEKSDKASESSLRNPRKKRKQQPRNKLHPKPKSTKKRKRNVTPQNAGNGTEDSVLEALPLEPFSFFLDEYQTANDAQVSSLEMESMQGTSFFLTNLDHILIFSRVCVTQKSFGVSLL